MQGGAGEHDKPAGETMNHTRAGEPPKGVVDFLGGPSGLANKFGDRPRPRGGLEEERAQNQLIDLIRMGRDPESGRMSGLVLVLRWLPVSFADHARDRRDGDRPGLWGIPQVLLRNR